jgi:hypothetical protein
MVLQQIVLHLFCMFYKMNTIYNVLHVLLQQVNNLFGLYKLLTFELTNLVLVLGTLEKNDTALIMIP